jgi:hypothetical protein
MTTENQGFEAENEKELIKGLGCFNLLIPALIPFIGIGFFAENSNPIITFLMYFLSLVGLTIALQGIFILSLPIVIIKAVFRRNTDKYLDERKFEKSRIWVIFPIALILFWLGYHLASGVEGDKIVYLSVGFVFALALYFMTKKGYFHPTDYVVEYG